MKLIKYGRTADGKTWGIAEEDHKYWLITGRTIFHVEDQIREGELTDVYPNFKRAFEAAKEL